MVLLKMSRRHVFDFQDAFEMRPMKRYKNGRRLSEGLVKWRRYEDGNDNWTDVPKIMVSFGAKIQILQTYLNSIIFRFPNFLDSVKSIQHPLYHF